MLREGFERVKAEMVSAAKELREKDKQKRDSARSDATLEISNVDEVKEDGYDQAKDLEAKEGVTASQRPLSADGIDWCKPACLLVLFLRD